MQARRDCVFAAAPGVVKSPGPGRIVAEQRITLERPRDVSSPEFNDIRRHPASSARDTRVAA